MTGHTNWIRSLAFHPSEGIVASSSNDRTIKLWDLKTRCLITTLKGHTNWICAIAFDSTGQTLASASKDETIKLWDIQTGECLKTLRADRPYEGMNITESQD